LSARNLYATPRKHVARPLHTCALQRNLIAKCVAAGKAHDDASVSPVVRQTLLHWGYELTQADYATYAKQVAKGARVPYIKGSVVALNPRAGAAGRAEAASEAAGHDETEGAAASSGAGRGRRADSGAGAAAPAGKASRKH
jgi:hypothetical protein